MITYYFQWPRRQLGINFFHAFRYHKKRRIPKPSCLSIWSLYLNQNLPIYDFQLAFGRKPGAAGSVTVLGSERFIWRGALWKIWRVQMKSLVGNCKYKKKMYDFIQKEEYLTPEESIKKYLYFSGEDELPKESWPTLQLPLEAFNLPDLHRNDFEELLRNSDLTEEQRKLYHSQFIRTKRIFKRQKAKMRYGAAASANLLTLEAQQDTGPEDRIVEEHSTTKAESESIDRDQDQKRKKRMSAQISRDRKKLYLERIEQENRALKLRNSQLEAQNSGLRKEMEAFRPKEKQLGKVDRSLKSFFIMSLILLTSVNKQFHKYDSHLSLNLSHETLLKRAAALLDEYNKQEITITLPQLEQFEKDMESEASKEQIKEEVDSLFQKTEYSSKPTIFLQTFLPKNHNLMDIAQGDRKIRKGRKRQCNLLQVAH